MTHATKKPRFIRVVRDGKMWLKERGQIALIGPFDSWADALAHQYAAEQKGDGRVEGK